MEIDKPSQTAADSMDLCRIIDAEGNRASEGLRVIEDFCRFSLNDSFLTRQLKQMRHELAQALAGIRTNSLAARATFADVGTSISTSQEKVRESITAVIKASFK